MVQLALLIKSFFEGEAYGIYFKQDLARSFYRRAEFLQLKIVILKRKKKAICMFNCTHLKITAAGHKKFYLHYFLYSEMQCKSNIMCYSSPLLTLLIAKRATLLFLQFCLSR